MIARFMGFRHGLALASTACAMLASSSCTFDDDKNPSLGCEGCPAGMCHEGFCFATGSDRPPSTGDRDAGAAGRGGAGGAGTGGTAGGGGTNGDGETGEGGSGGGNGAGDAGSAGTGGSEPPPVDGDEPCVEGDFCYEGPAGTRTVGRCRAGEKSCDGELTRACLGQVTPGEEVCNGLDDDCDGATDEDVALGSCAAAEPGVCAAGELTCESGVSTCRSTVAAGDESCNGQDDDCDGATDEDSDAACYPDATSGCAASDGGFECEGRCRSGTRVCQAGGLLACAGFVAPAAAEACDGSTTGTGTDEDCDGAIDEGCECPNGDEQECYTGPAGTAGVGTCDLGTQVCSGGEFGACTGSNMPVAESCANEGEDNDCDGTEDDVIGRGVSCTVSEGVREGVCRNGTRQCSGGSLICVTPEPPADAETTDEPACDGRDEDCDGAIDDGFDLDGDEANCGVCGRACAAGETCCGGSCTDLDADGSNCGECGVQCGDGMTCCGGGCADLSSDAANCGECGVDCSAFTPAAADETCSCDMGGCASLSGPCTM